MGYNGDVPLVGTFGTMALPELLQWLGDQRRSGLLTLIDGLREHYLRIVDGSIDAVGTVEARPSGLVDVLVSRGAVDAASFTAELVACDSANELRQALIDAGLVTSDAVDEAIAGYAEDVVIEFFLAEDGRFVFVAADEDAGHNEAVIWHLPLNSPVDCLGLLMDGIRRMDEWSRMRDVFPHDNVLVHALDAAPDLPAVTALAQSSVPVTVGDLRMRLGVPTFRVVEQLHEGVARGLVAVSSESAPEAAGVEGQGRAFVDNFLNAAEALLEAEQFEEAGALVQRVRELDPLDRTANALWKRIRTQHTAQLYRYLPAAARPRAAGDIDKDVPLSREERYLLYRADGSWDVAGLVGSSLLSELQTLRVLERLIRRGLVDCR